MVDFDRLQAAYRQARADLIAQREPSGHWVGELASSALSTATAISALVLAEQHGRRMVAEYVPDEIYQGDLSELIVHSLHWLAKRQNADGGWGDTEKSLSNVATTMLVRAAFHLTGVPVKFADLLQRADAYIESQGGVAGLKRRYGKDKTFAVPILTNLALADLVPWKKVMPLPFELACLPHSWYRFLHLPVVSYAIPALVAIGHARFYHRPPKNPIMRAVRRSLVPRSLSVLERMQPESGGFLEATPLTSFVVMSLAGAGQADHRVTRRGVEFLLASVRPDGSWPIDTNLATWNTSLALNALASAPAPAEGEPLERVQAECLDWLLDCQHSEKNPYTETPPGGWAWTDRSGGVPDVDDTSAALIALAQAMPNVSLARQQKIRTAARAGIEWLLEIQNRDGGWPTFCRGWGTLPCDRSGSDLTAHALRALNAWRMLRGSFDQSVPSGPQLHGRIERAITLGLRFLSMHQRPDGSWLPLWFGNQHLPGEENPIYGTARVLMAYRDLELIDSAPARRGLAWLAANQQADGGWGGGPAAIENGCPAEASTVEETSLATEALLAGQRESSLRPAIEKGLDWLVTTVERGGHAESASIGLYFAKLWYHERLYSYVHAVSALGRAVNQDAVHPALPLAAYHL